MFSMNSLIQYLRARRLARQIGAFGVGSKWYGGDVHCKKQLFVGDHVYIGPGFTAHAFGNIEIGDGTVLGPRVTIHTRNHNYTFASTVPYDGEYKHKPVKIGKGVWVSDGVILLPGANIGDGCVIAAGAVVRDSVPPFSIVGGNPAKVIRQRVDADHVKELIGLQKYYLKQKCN
jgi:acetyltransferase-like isoleucine patch superfamily enzyme